MDAFLSIWSIKAHMFGAGCPPLFRGCGTTTCPLTNDPSPVWAGTSQGEAKTWSGQDMNLKLHNDKI